MSLLLLLSGRPASATLWYDTFSGTAGNPDLNTHSPTAIGAGVTVGTWQGTAGVATIVSASNTLQEGNYGSGNRRFTRSLGVDVCDIELDVAWSGADVFPAIDARSTGATTDGIEAGYDAGAWFISNIPGGVTNTLTEAIPSSAGTMRLEIRTGSASLYWNGVLKVTYTATLPNAATGTFVGVVLGNFSAGGPKIFATRFQALTADVPATTVTGVVTTGQGGETSSLASAEVVTGTAASANAAETGSLSGAEVFTGAVTSANSAETSTLASAEVVSGALASATAATTSTLSGTESMAGAASSANAAETSTLASTEVITGAIASATAAESSALTGLEVFTGAVASANAAETSTLASAEVITGSVSSGTAATTSALTGEERFVGVVSSADAPQTATLSSAEVITGTIATTNDAQSSTVSGAVNGVSGAVSTANAAQTATLASAEVITGSGTSATPVQSSTLAGEQVVTGTIASASPPQTATLASDEVVTGAIATAQPAQSSALAGESTASGTVIGSIETANAPQTSALGSTLVVTGVVETGGAASVIIVPAPAPTPSVGGIAYLPTPARSRDDDAEDVRIFGFAATGQAAQSSDVQGTSLAHVRGAIVSAQGAQETAPGMAPVRATVVLPTSMGRGGSSQPAQSSALRGRVIDPPRAVRGRVESWTPPQASDVVGAVTPWVPDDDPLDEATLAAVTLLMETV